MKRKQSAAIVCVASIALAVMSGAAFAATINVTDWAGALAAAPVAGDTVQFAAGTYTVTEPINVVGGVTYKGAGPGATTLNGGGVSRAFNAWGDRGVNDGVLDAPLNNTGQKGWVIRDMTITNGQSDAANKQDILSVARNLHTNFTLADDPTNGRTPPGDGNNLLSQAEAELQQAALIDNPAWFPILAGADSQISLAELDAYLTANPPGSAGHLIANGDKDDDGGALNVDNGAEGTVINVEFLANHTLNQGGAIAINGPLTVLTVDGCIFDGNTVPVPADDDAPCIRQEGGNASFQQGSSLYLYNSIIRNHTGDQGTAVMVGAAYSTTVVKNCLLENNQGDGNGGLFISNNDRQKQADIINCVIRNNSMPAAGADLIHIRGGYGSKVVNNTFIGNTLWATGQALIGNRQGVNPPQDLDGSGAFDAGDETVIVVHNNIFKDNVVQNNLTRGNRAGGTPSDPTSIPNTTWGFIDLNNNITFNNTTTAGAAAGYIANNNQHVGGVAPPAPITTDPNINATTFVPNAGSPAIDAGNPAVAPADDNRGWARVGVADIGALEFGATAPAEGEGEGEGEPVDQGNTILSNVYPPFIDEGTTVILTGPAGTLHQWIKDDVEIPGATNRTLVFEPVTEEDAGIYKVQYDNGLKVITVSDPFNLIVTPEGTVPAVGILGLVALAGACGLGGARLVRRRK